MQLCAADAYIEEICPRGAVEINERKSERLIWYDKVVECVRLVRIFGEALSYCCKYLERWTERKSRI